jgi:HTH-type transcriptional regulator / antitoxin HigA
MIMSDTGSFTPLWASPPGETIRTRLAELDLDVAQLAEQLGTSTNVANGLLDGREMITIDLAKRLSHFVGGSAEFWVNRDCQYRDDLARVQTDRWLSDLPVQAMTTLGWISPESTWISRARACLSFFGVADLDGWRSTYEPILASSRMRISETVPSKSAAVAAWLHRATGEAGEAHTADWSEHALRDNLNIVKKLTWNKDPGRFIPQLRDLLADSGVALVVLQALPGCPASGAAKFLSPERAMIAVSGRFLADDQFWFTVVHEIGHLLLHRPADAILDDPYSLDDDVESRDEREANHFAAAVLLPANVRARIPDGRISHRNIISLARAAGVSPGVVVGQLQFMGRVQRNQFNSLKRRYKWSGPNLETA